MPAVRVSIHMILVPLILLALISAFACAQQPARPAVATVFRSPAPVGATTAAALAAVTPSATAEATAGLPSATASVATSTPILAGSAYAASAATQVAAAPGPVLDQSAIVLGPNIALRSAPSMVDGHTIATLADRQPITIVHEVRGQRWVVGNQTWPMAYQAWSNLWYQVAGGYVYAGFVYIPRPGEAQTLATAGDRWIDVNLATQTASAMIGNQTVFSASVTTGKPGYVTPAGDYTLPAWGRVFDETMTSKQAGITDPQQQYDVHNVLYTQYFDGAGDALHLNYWQPASVFGNARTSHGCVGLQLHDAQFFWLFTQAGMRVHIHPVPPPTPTPAGTAALRTTPHPAAPSATAVPGASVTDTATSMPASPSALPEATPPPVPSSSLPASPTASNNAGPPPVLSSSVTAQPPRTSAPPVAAPATKPALPAAATMVSTATPAP